MNWIDCAERMERYVIKNDGTAVDNDYFMATHVPFQNLELTEFGSTETRPGYVTEENIYRKYIINSGNRHQMIIVRGPNGTGKSHLICWLHNRYIADSENYNPEKEKVIFLRRLGNTVRGAVQQMLKEGLVGEGELKERFEDFINASDSQTEEELKTTIYSAYINKVLTDTSDVFFKKIQRKEIAAFMNDSRVRDYMMRSTGPVDRCYRMITAKSRNQEQDDDTETIFLSDDFDLPREIEKAIKRNASEEARSFYLDELRGEEALIEKLTDYLNRYTSGVIQRCANISSETARDLFVSLRQSLFKEGKNLTLFIEDFTSFSIVESELITALSVENGGNYNDLCRVTSIIGITDGYYNSFRDNFKDRVTEQINVTDISFNQDEFLYEMAARYLNAIYCTRNEVHNWYENNYTEGSLPITDFKPAYDWDYVQIGEREYTLYPFSKRSLRKLYDSLINPSPRHYLNYVIRHFFRHFAEGKEYGDGWVFPKVPPYIKNISLEPPYSNIVEKSGFKDVDKTRLTVLFSIWGNEKTDETEITIGDIPKDFLQEIGLGNFKGNEIEVIPDQGIGGGNDTGGSEPNPGVSTPDPQNPDPSQPQVLTKEEKNFNRYKNDIESWYMRKTPLESFTTFVPYLKDFIGQATSWQEMGYPAELVLESLNQPGYLYIEDAKATINKDKAIVVLERNVETYTILMGMNYFIRYGCWDFKQGAYYQLFLINWLEKNKESIASNMFQSSIGNREHPLITWGLAEEYLRHMLMYSKDIGKLEELELIRCMMIKRLPDENIKHINSKWNDTSLFLTNKDSDSDMIRSYIQKASRTYMGIVRETTTASTIPFYRYRDIKNSLNHLEASNWDIEKELDNYEGQAYVLVRKHLKEIYERIRKILAEEKIITQRTLKNFEELAGTKPDIDSYLEVIAAANHFFEQCNASHELYDSKLKMAFEGTPKELAQKVIGLYEELKESLKKPEDISLLSFYMTQPNEHLTETIIILNNLQKFAEDIQKKHEAQMAKANPVEPEIVEDVLGQLEDVSERVERLEVSE